MRAPAGVRFPTYPVVLAGAAALNAALALKRPGGMSSTLLLLLPLLIVLFGMLVASRRAILVAAAMGLSMTFPVLQKPLPLPTPGQVYLADLIVILAIVAWVARRLTAPPEARPHGPTTPLIGPPLILFAVVMLSAALHGHYAYGANIIGQPVRLFAYALLVFALLDLDPRATYRVIVGVFYVGTVWMFLNAAHYLATGTSQTDQIDLSTGGKRVLSLATAIYLSGALFLALLNLELDREAKRRAVHLLVAALALAGIVVAYGRATYLAVALIVPVLFIWLPRLRRSVFSMLPVCLPFILLLAIALPRVAPSVGTTFTNRVQRSNSTDVNVLWRQAAAETLWEQVHESPITGVGFGKSASFRFNGIPVNISQDPHDSYLYLLAGGGVLALGGFALILLTFTVDAVGRLRRVTDPYQRLLLLWSMAMLASFLINAGAGPVLSDPRMLLTIWALLLLPSSIAPAASGTLTSLAERRNAPHPRAA
jgi:hypothetical protein